MTINVDDFWRKIDPHPTFCIVTIELTQEQAPEATVYLRRLLRLPAFRTKARRLGKVIRVTPTTVEYYSTDKLIHSLAY